MDLPGLKESLKEMNLIGGLKMEKPKVGGIEGLPKEENPFHDSDLIKDFATHTIVLQNKFMEIVDENLRLKKENQRLRVEQSKIREILGEGNAGRT